MSETNPTENYLIRRGKPAVVLAPMEGVTDAPMRALLTEVGGFDFCVSEFLRVSQTPLGKSVIARFVPESFHRRWATPTGVPVVVQFLGGDPDRLLLSAQAAVAMGAIAIDINFGCPAPTVNRHDGGASLLKCPDRIENIIWTIRKNLPSTVSVSAKLRLGWEDSREIFENAKRAQNGGADWITIHARTKVQGYKPPVFWDLIGEAAAQLTIPVVANGDIWSFEDFLECKKRTNCEHFMLGRGAVANPRLAPQISTFLKSKTTSVLPLQTDPRPNNQMPLSQWIGLFQRFHDISMPHTKSQKYLVARLKQWFKMIEHQNRLPFEFEQIKSLQSFEDIIATIHTNSI